MGAGGDRAGRAAGATLVAGHSAHVFHGVADRVLYDLGDFVNDYAIDPVLRNDLGLLFLVTFDGPRPVHLEAVPLVLDDCHTRLAGTAEAHATASPSSTPPSRRQPVSSSGGSTVNV